jgi:Leucine Rich repeat
MSEGSAYPKFLSSKVAFSITHRQKMPYPSKEFPKLSNMCIGQLSDNFDRFPALDGIEKHFKERVYENMGVGFKMATLAKHVDYDPYWKKACVERWKLQRLPNEHKTWRSAFFSKYLQEKIENMEDLENEYSDLVDLLKVMASDTFRLRIDQVKVDFDVSDLIGKLANLTYLRIAWVKKVISGPFNTQQLGMSLNDANNTANLIVNLKDLESLELTCNKLDDDGIKIIMKSLEDHPSLKHISFSHNKIGNVGARRASRIFGKNKTVVSMDLSNNLIGYEGARCLSMVLSEPTCQLEHLNLSLNLISDKAVTIMISDLAENTKLKHLDLSSNLLTDEVFYINLVGSTVQTISAQKQDPGYFEVKLQQVHTRHLQTIQGMP